ncbi:MAG: hypothetical protein HY855_16930 [Burkholderiales bacterium]|nr:hypothetical protein [Burkholderiales bacterium]
MDQAAFTAFVTSLEDIFASLYLLDVGSMSAAQKEAHQVALNTAYIAMLRAQNQELKNLTDKAVKQAGQLAAATAAMQAQLAGLKKVAQVLQVVSAGLNVLSSVAKLFK